MAGITWNLKLIKIIMNILVTAIGSFSADCVIRTLKQNGHKVVGCDIYPAEWHAVSKDCDSVYKVPFATKEIEYISFLKEVCLKESIEFLFPLTDLEIDVLNRNRNVFSKINVILCMQLEKCLEIARNKYAMYELFVNDENINVPYSVSSEKLSLDFPLPAIAKPINGRSSEGLKIISCKEDIKSLIGIGNYIIQECISGSIYTVDYVRDINGSDFAVPREELLRTKNGAGVTVKVIPEERLINSVSYIGKVLSIVGCVNMEFISNNGNFYLIDINPRFSAGVAFSSYIGYDMVTNHLNSFIGNAISPSIEIREQILYKRFHEEAF